MAGGNKRPRAGGLLSELDHRIRRVLQDYMEEEQAIAVNGSTAFPGTAVLVEYVRDVDIGLRRSKEIQIRNSIQRVVPELKRQLEQSQIAAKQRLASTMDAEAASLEQSSDEEPEVERSASFSALEPVPTMEVKDANAMNGSLRRLWGAKCNEPAEEAVELGPTVGKRRAQRTTEHVGENSGREKEARKKRRGKVAEKAVHSAPQTRLVDLGGVEACIEEVLELIVMPLKHPEIYAHTGVQPPRGVLLHGPPGCGKTMLAHAIAGEVGVPFLQISAPSVVSGMSGESEKKLREVFAEARALAPCIVFIDEIDAITPKRENAQREMERRIVAQMLTCVDDLSWEKTDRKPVMLIGATNRPDSLDPALRRAGRFDREIALPVPDEEAREQILGVMCKRLQLSGDFDIKELARRTPGYVGADLNALTTAAGMNAVKRIFHMLQAPSDMLADTLSQTAMGDSLHTHRDTSMDLGMDNGDANANKPTLGYKRPNGDFNVSNPALVYEQPSTPMCWDAQPPSEKLRTIAAFLERHPDPLSPEELAPLAITNVDFIQALGKVQPSAQREGFATVPGVSWDDIGALASVREELRMAVVEPIRNPALFAQVGITAPAGVLLWGPPGNGKTLLAKAIANDSHTNFISVKGGELMSKYVGDSERAVRQVFSRARASSPCVVFFDELDALCSRRGGDQSEASARVVNTLLTEIDGMDSRKGVYVIAATNRPDIIDPAMLRPGRLDKLLYVELPTSAERADILRTLSKKTPLAPDVNLDMVAADQRCSGFSGADLAGLVREASVTALRLAVFSRNAAAATAAPDNPAIIVTYEHFEAALQRTAPSVSAADMRRYDSLRKLYGS
ncbi:Ribosome biogenesis ATPase rix7 [Coemansia sp. RSA 988]|nr:Ribosome biogenesis ATPase rix7 [Coemansia sp. RSA 988]